MFTRSAAYPALKQFCTDNLQQVLPLILEKLDADGLKTVPLLYETTLPEYQAIFDHAIAEKERQTYTKDGKVIIRHAQSDAIFYGKRLLEEVQKQVSAKTNLTSGISSLTAFPNPANSVVNIAFELTTAANITLQIVDMQGRIVADLVVNEQKNAGLCVQQWNVSSVDAGIYLAKLTVGDYLQIKKNQVVK